MRERPQVLICGTSTTVQSLVENLHIECAITLLDENQERLEHITQRYDIRTVMGKPTFPESLALANADQCDILIAVTDSDEDNMMICQIASALFDVQELIASIQDHHYFHPQWKHLFSKDNLSINLPVMPAKLLAQATLEQLMVHGLCENVPILNTPYHFLVVPVDRNSSMHKETISSIQERFALPIIIVGCIRNQEPILWENSMEVEKSDTLLVLLEHSYLERFFSVFFHYQGGEEKKKVIIMGAGHAGVFLAQKLNEYKINYYLVEENIDRAKEVAQILKTSRSIVKGHGQDYALLKEIDIANSRALCVMGGDDEDNILCSVVAKREQCQRVICSYKDIKYQPLMQVLDVDVALNRGNLFASYILPRVRGGNVRQVRTLSSHSGKQVEILTLIVSEHSPHAYKIYDQNLHALMNKKNAYTLGAITRDGKMLLPSVFHHKETTGSEEGSKVFKPQDDFESNERIKVQPGDLLIFLVLNRGLPEFKRAFQSDYL